MRPEDILQSNDHQNSLVMVEKQKRRSVNRIETSEESPDMYSQLLFDKNIENNPEVLYTASENTYGTMVLKKNVSFLTRLKHTSMI